MGEEKSKKPATPAKRRMEQIQAGLKEVGAGWRAGPQKTMSNKYWIYPNEATQESIIGFRSLVALEQWIEEQRVRNVERAKHERKEVESIRSHSEE